MVDEPRQPRVHHVMHATASERAAHYREQAAQLRALAAAEQNERLRRDLFDIALKYDQLAVDLSKRR
jgi:hypothetical protein